MNSARFFHKASILANGNILVAGGTPDGSYIALSSVEVYNPSTGLWTTIGTMSIARFYHTVSILANGNVLVVGGSPDFISALNSAEVYG
ncbi:unnamed protein product [Adineta steineri]|nr:unnamed protein product [Adineta steineri]